MVVLSIILGRADYLPDVLLMRAFYSSHRPGKNKGHVTSYMSCHEICVTEVHVPYFSLLQIVSSID